MFSLYFPPLLYPVVCYHPSYSHPKQMNAGLQEARVWWINFYQKIWQQIEDDEFRLGLRILTPFLSRKISKVQDGPGCIEQVQSPRPFDQNNHKEGYGKDAYSPGQNTVVGSLSLLQGIFPAHWSNSGLLHCRQILYQLSHKRSPRTLEWVSLSLLQWIFLTQELNPDLLHYRWIIYQLSYQESPGKNKKCYFCIVGSSSLIAFKILVSHLAGLAEEKTSWCDWLVRAPGMESSSPNFN